MWFFYFIEAEMYAIYHEVAQLKLLSTLRTGSVGPFFFLFFLRGVHTKRDICELNVGSTYAINVNCATKCDLTSSGAIGASHGMWMRRTSIWGESSKNLTFLASWPDIQSEKFVNNGGQAYRRCVWAPTPLPKFIRTWKNEKNRRRLKLPRRWDSLVNRETFCVLLYYCQPEVPLELTVIQAQCFSGGCHEWWVVFRVLLVQ